MVVRQLNPPLEETMSRLGRTAWLIASVFTMIGSAPALAQVQSNADAEIAGLKRQLLALERKLDKLQKQTARTTVDKGARPKLTSNASVSTAVPVKNPVWPSGAIIKMPNNRPTICTADDLNCISVTSRLNFDVGGYEYHPNSSLTNPQQAQDGVNARRARIGVLGTFMGAWDYGLIYEFGGTQDGKPTLLNAYLTYKGIKDLYIDGGYIDVPYTLDEATSSNDILFMERSSAQTIAKGIAAGNRRAAFGAHANGDWWWLGSYVTGPTSGFDHTKAAPVGMTARGVLVPVNNRYASILLGADAEFLFDTGGAVGPSTLPALSDRIELRIDPGTNALLNTGALTNVRSARVLSGEAAAQYGSFYAQGEYFDDRIDRSPGLPGLNFNGGYAEASYVFTGEQRRYNPVAGSYSGIKPNNPFDWGTGGWGAWEIAARYTQMQLNDLDVLGGEMKNITVGLNWYVNTNVRFMFNWIHGSVAKSAAAPATGDIGAHYDAVAMRAQVAF
jgi:phosphate-selective porin OprO and OprP